MTSPRTEARFAIGSRAGPRSTIWKAWVSGDETYITSRMFGSDLKVSIHSSGVCQWSCTDSYVRRKALRSNSERHIVRWQVDVPPAGQALLAFRVQVPVSELRAQPEPNDKKKVFWLSEAPPESTVQFLFYLTHWYATDPAEHSPLPYRHLFSLRLRSGRWLIVLVDLISLSDHDLDCARVAVREQLASAGLKAESSHRSCLFIQAGEGTPCGLLELCPAET